MARVGPFLTSTAIAGSLSAALTARAQPARPGVAQCVDAYNMGQRLRRAGKPVEAREQLLVCSDRACPRAAQTDCARWLDEVESALPSVVLEAVNPRDDDVSDVRVTIDDRGSAAANDGRPIPLDPGEHTLVFHRPDGASVRRRVTLAEGEKQKAVRVVFPAATRVASVSPEVVADEGGARGGVPALAWILGGAGLAAVGAGVYLDVSGKQEEGAMLSTCAPDCAQSRVDEMRRRVLAGDVALGVGLVSAGVATWIALSQAGSPTSVSSAVAVRVDVQPSRSGAAFAVRGTF